MGRRVVDTDNSEFDLDTVIAAGLPPVVTQVEAEAGTEVASRTWSPERVKQAVVALTPPPANNSIEAIKLKLIGETYDFTTVTAFKVPEPASSDGATTKNYVDALVNGLVVLSPRTERVRRPPHIGGSELWTFS